MSEQAHPILPSSSANIWGAPDGCLGWVNMMSQLPDSEPSEASLEGDAAHEVSLNLIQARINFDPDFDPAEWLGTEAPCNGVVISEEIIDGAEMYANDFLAVYREAKEPIYGLEKRLNIPRVHTECFGTADAWLYDRGTGILYIWDFKFGFIVVEPFRNLQAACYLAGIFDVLATHGIIFTESIKVRIAQPRAIHKAGPIREWVTNGATVTELIEGLKVRAEQAMNLRAKVRSGPHCKYCNARTRCEAAIRAGLQLFEVSASSTPVDLKPQEVGTLMTFIDRAFTQIKSLRAGFEEHAKVLQKQGKSVPGWSLESSPGREAWNKSTEEVVTLGDLMGVDLRKEGTLTPNQARKAGVPAEVVAQYSHRPNGSVKLVRDDNEKIKLAFGE